MVSDFCLTLGTVLYLVAEPSGEDRHRVSDGEIICGLQLNDIRPENKGVGCEKERNRYHQKRDALFHIVPPLV